MTKKRYSFNVNKMTIEKDGKYFAYTTVEHNKIVSELNEQHETIQRYQTTLEDMLQHERTHIGQSVLKQYKEAIQ